MSEGPSYVPYRRGTETCCVPPIPFMKGKEMSLPAKVLIPFVAGLLLAGAAQAQLLPTWETHITLTQQDLDMIRNAVTNQVHGKPVGTTADWRNPASGNSGSIKLVKNLTRTL